MAALYLQVGWGGFGGGTGVLEDASLTSLPLTKFYTNGEELMLCLGLGPCWLYNK